MRNLKRSSGTHPESFIHLCSFSSFHSQPRALVPRYINPSIHQACKSMDSTAAFYHPPAGCCRHCCRCRQGELTSRLATSKKSADDGTVTAVQYIHTQRLARSLAPPTTTTTNQTHSDSRKPEETTYLLIYTDSLLLT